MSITAEEFDRIFDEGKEDILQYCDMDNVTHPNQPQQSINIQLSKTVLQQLNAQALDMGITVEDLVSQLATEKATVSPHV